MSRSARHRSHEAYGVGDELRVALVADGIYWGAAAFLRDAGRRSYTEQEVALVRALAPTLAAGMRRTVLRPSVEAAPAVDYGPGVVLLAEDGSTESISPAALRWVEEIVEEPTLTNPAESKVVQAVAARARAIALDAEPLDSTARARVRTRTGVWLLLYGTRLCGDPHHVAVIIQPAAPQEIAPVVALSYGLSQRECQVTMLCMQGRATKEMARELGVSGYTVQDHLKSVFTKTGVRSRGELVGQVFLDHYTPRWEHVPTTPDGWWAKGFSNDLQPIRPPP